MLNMPKGPFCQSCGMPMEENEELFGTESNGEKTSEYCFNCYKDGSYTEPDITLEQIQEKVYKYLTETKKIPAFHAKMVSNAFIPKLKRWQ